MKSVGGIREIGMEARMATDRELPRRVARNRPYVKLKGRVPLSSWIEEVTDNQQSGRVRHEEWSKKARAKGPARRARNQRKSKRGR
jgi:hypothetical protein